MVIDMKHRYDTQISDFKCKHCHNYVTTNPEFSGVGNRNHCPYCLWSRHMDLFEAGDRLAACKAEMQPVGLSLKQARKKYGSSLGELMLIHRCVDCGQVSINRTAADDDAENIMSIFSSSLKMLSNEKSTLVNTGIQVLSREHEELVRLRLYGQVNR
jgi:hypothetical protein